MSVAPITSVAAATPPKVVVVPTHETSKSNQGQSFSELITNVLKEANLEQHQADAALQGLVTGKVDNVHDVVLSVAKADLTFRFLLEVRNRLTEAYQEISRMQF